MNEEKNMRLSQVARKLNVGTDTIASFLAQKGFVVDNKPNAKITAEQFNLLAAEFISAGVDKQEAAHVTIGKAYPTLSAAAGKHNNVKSKDQAKKKTTTQTKVKRGGDADHAAHYEASIPV